MKSRTWIGIIVAVVVLGGSCVGYPVAKIRWSSRQVRQFCDEVAIGAPIDGLKARAAERWLNVIESPPRAEEPGKLVFWQGWVFARHLCEIHYVDNVVTEKRTSSLD
ncbi:MAG: hypothetical protein ABI193_08315 [Minicystis sp.]